MTKIDFAENSSLTSLGNWCFYGCSSLKEIEIDAPVSEFGVCCFDNCSSMEKAVFSDKFVVSSLRRNCFDGCVKLAEVKLPSSLTQLEASTFNGCQALKSIKLPSGIKSLGQLCFSDCKTLSEIQLSESLQEINRDCFNGCSSLKTLTIPASVETIGAMAFANTGIENLYFSEGLASLASYSFTYMSNLKKVLFPSTLETVGTGIFDSSDAITDIVCMAVTPPDYEAIMQSLPLFSSYIASHATLYVPEESVQKYKDDKNWGVFYKIEPYKGTTGIKETLLTGVSIDVSDGLVNISGLNKGTLVAAYSIDGKLLASQVSDGKTTLNVGSGVVVLKIGKQATKIFVQ